MFNFLLLNLPVDRAPPAGQVAVCEISGVKAANPRPPPGHLTPNHPQHAYNTGFRVLGDPSKVELCDQIIIGI